MFLNVLLIADWHAIARTHEHHVNENLQCANRKQRQYNYAPGLQVLKKVHNPAKLGVRTKGPYTIERIQVNGNLTISLRAGITERINIRRVLPYTRNPVFINCNHNYYSTVINYWSVIINVIL
jgi:hypothetical protein